MRYNGLFCTLNGNFETLNGQFGAVNGQFHTLNGKKMYVAYLLKIQFYVFKRIIVFVKTGLFRALNG